MRRPPPTILLFDIDGTLITTGGAGRRAIEHAFERHTGRRDACSGISFAGMTDRAIVRGGLLAIGRPADEAAIDALLAAYLEVLHDEVRTADGYRLNEGIEAALAAVCGRSGCAVGLG